MYYFVRLYCQLLVDSYEYFTHVLQGFSLALVRLSQFQWGHLKVYEHRRLRHNKVRAVYIMRGALHNMRYPSKNNLKPQSRTISFVYNISFNCLFVLKFCREHGSYTAVLCAKVQNDWATAKYLAQIGTLSFQAAIEHKPRQVRWVVLHAPVVTEWWPACFHKQFPS